MQISPTAEVKVHASTQADSSDIQCFMEKPRKTGKDKPLVRMSAFDLFTLFTADIIRSKKIFTR